MGKYDIPAKVDYISKFTHKNNGKVSYVGHSQGTSQLFSALCDHPHTNSSSHYTNQIDNFIALGPVTNISNLGSDILSKITHLNIDKFLMKFGLLNEFMPFSKRSQQIQNFICSSFGRKEIPSSFCYKVLEKLSDPEPDVNDPVGFMNYIRTYSGGSSLKSMHHFSEIIRNKSFYNINNNYEIKEKNDNTDPSPYELDKIKHNGISLLIGKDDLLATVDDNRNLKSLLENNDLKLKFYKEYDKMGHLTFLTSRTDEYIKDVLSILSN